jgi:hypothetical protein
MLKKFMKKQEIERILEPKGDFIRINLLGNYLKLMPPIEMRKFAYSKLAEIYLKKEMFNDAAKMFKNIGLNSVAFREKRENYLRECKSYIRALEFDSADKALKRAFDEANIRERREMYGIIVEFYKKEAEGWIKNGKKEKASKVYEKLIRMKISEEEKKEIREILLDLYDKLGKREDYNFLKGV